MIFDPTKLLDYSKIFKKIIKFIRIKERWIGKEKRQKGSSLEFADETTKNFVSPRSLIHPIIIQQTKRLVILQVMIKKLYESDSYLY